VSSPAGNPRGTNFKNPTIVFPGTARNYQARAGDLWSSSIVAAAIGWIGANVHQAPLVAYRRVAGQDKPQRTPHAIEQLLAKPNRYYSYQVLMASTMLSLVVSGNAYWYVVRDNAGLPIELWWIPHTMIEPAWPGGATTENWITHYSYTQPNGVVVPLLVEDVLHFREGTLDPRNPRKSLSRLGTALRQIAKEHDIENYEATLISNMGVPGLVISPGDKETEFGDEELEKIRDIVQDRTSGDERGKPLAFKTTTKIDMLGFSPEQLLLDHASDTPEARICALIGISPIVLELNVGLKEATYNNKQGSRQSSWEDGIIPRLLAVSGELSVQLVPLFEDSESVILRPDLSDVAALAPNRNEMYKRLKDATGGPFMEINEARVEAGLPPLDDTDLARFEALRTKPPPVATDKPGDNNVNQD
jgi:HK97 family phage portal protein